MFYHNKEKKEMQDLNYNSTTTTLHLALRSLPCSSLIFRGGKILTDHPLLKRLMHPGVRHTAQMTHKMRLKQLLNTQPVFGERCLTAAPETQMQNLLNIWPETVHQHTVPLVLTQKTS